MRPRPLALLPLLAAFVPPALITGHVARDAVNVPLTDQWVFAAQVVEASTGQLRLVDLWAPNNEHRNVLPRLIMLGLARLTAWDVRWEMAVDVLVALTTLALLASLIGRTVRPRAPGLAPWLVLAASLFTFSLGQWQNWTWGWQMAIFLNALAATASACALARWGARGPGPAILLGAALAATFSFASGLLLLGLGPLGLVLLPAREQHERRWLAAALLMVVGAGVAAIYLTGLPPAAGQSAPTNPLAAPTAFAAYVFTYLGAPLGGFEAGVALRWGMVGVIAGASAAGWLWSRSPVHRAGLVPWIVLGLYALSSAGMTAVGRMGAGSQTALLSRYATISALFWVSVTVVVALALAAMSALRGKRAAVAAALAATACAVPGYWQAWVKGDVALQLRAQAARRGAACMRYLDWAPDDCLRMVCWDADILRLFAGGLREQRLGPFADVVPEPPLTAYQPADGPAAGTIGRVVITGALARELIVDGEAVPARALVLVVVDGTVAAHVQAGTALPETIGDTSEHIGPTSWTIHLGGPKLTPGAHRLEAYVLVDAQRIARLEGGRMVELGPRARAL
jgi:hypothetical protein